MKIRWTKQAQEQLSEVYDYVASYNTDAAERQIETINAAVLRLNGFPEMGRSGRVVGTRELVIPGTPYIVAYKPMQATIWVLAVLHGAQRWPKRF